MLKAIRYFLKTLKQVSWLQDTFFKNSFWAIGGNVVIKGLSFLASLFIVKFLGSKHFGELSVIKTTLGVFGLIASFGLDFTVTKLISESIAKNKQTVGKIISATNVTSFCLGFGLAGLLFIFSSFLSIIILKNEALVLPLRIAAFFLFFNTLNRYQIGIISGLQLFKKMAKVNAIVGFISFPNLLTLTYFFGLNGTLIGLTINLVINYLLNYYIIRKTLKTLDIKIKYQKLKTKTIEILHFSLPLALKEAIYSIGVWLSTYLLLIKTSYGEVGIFNSANQISQIILFIPAAISGVTLSMLSEKHTSVSYSALVKQSLKFNIIVTLTLAIVISLFSTVIYDFYGSSYDGGHYVLYILVFATIPMSLINVLEQICISKAKTNTVSIFTFLGQAFILIFAFIFFFYSQKAITLAFAYLIGYSLFTTVMYYYLHSKRLV